MAARRIVALVACCALGAGLALFGSYRLGARNAERKHADAIAAIEQDYAEYRADADRSMGELRLALDESKGRVDAIGRGLASAVDLARGVADRGRRIAILIDGIDEALRAIRGEPDD